MFSLRITYLTGRVYASRFEDGDEKLTVEWPPHPGRLYAALVSAWGETGADPELRPALEWLETRPQPPAILFTEASARRVVNSYVPVNDTRTSAGIEMLPDHRPRRARTLPSASPLDPHVYFVWPDDLPGRLRVSMDNLLRRTTYLGHSASLVALEMVERTPDRLSVLAPAETGTIRMRVPSAGRLNELCERHARFRENPNKVNRPNQGRTARYGQPQATVPVPVPRSVFGEMIIFRRVRGDGMPLSGTYQLTTAMRGAMLTHAPDPCLEVISGHGPGSTPERPVRSERPHVALVPLAFVGSPHATGQVLGLAALLPSQMIPDEQEQCLRALLPIRVLKMAAAGIWEIAPTGSETLNYNLRADVWTKASRQWATVTPFVFDRFPKGRFGKEAENVVRQACKRVSLPEPATVGILAVSPHIGVPPAAHFAPAPLRPGKPKRLHQHVVLTFDEPVCGPISLGAGRYYGYGFCRPLW